MKNNNDAKRREALMQTPTPYVFDLLDIPLDKYVDTLNILFSNPDFKAVVDKRNKFVKSVQSMRENSSEIRNIIGVVQKYDRKIADTIFAVLVQTNLRSDVTLEQISYEEMVAKHIDQSIPGMKERMQRLNLNLDKLVFLTDMLETVLTDVKGDMHYLTNGKYDFNQFDAVQAAMNSMSGFFSQVRGKDVDRPDSQLYMDYADSINDYLAMRLKTYSEKLAKIRKNMKQQKKK